MYTINLGKMEIDLERLDEAAHFIPSGMSVWDREREEFDLEAFHCYGQLKNPNRLRKSLGTLGGGNHFIEVDSSRDGTKYLIIHSGSRNLGKQERNCIKTSRLWNIRRCRIYRRTYAI